MTADEHHINTAPASPAKQDDGEDEIAADDDDEDSEDDDELMDEDAIAGGSVSHPSPGAMYRNKQSS